MPQTEEERFRKSTRDPRKSVMARFDYTTPKGAARAPWNPKRDGNQSWSLTLRIEMFVGGAL